jgi:phosphoribosylamine--glycine ligase
MGAFAPSPLIDAATHQRVMSTIVDPVIAGMAAEGHLFTGFLYVGLMLTADGPKVIEFNVRLGDPEAQVILPLIREPFAELLASAARGSLAGDRCQLSGDVTVGVVLASRGYPESAESGQPIRGIDDAARRGVQVYHAGTSQRNGALVTAGGRVLTVTAQAGDFASAIAHAYEGVAAISFDGMQYRRDIGRKALGVTG